MFNPTIESASFLNSAQEPVVKSWQRVPTAMIRSASSAMALAADVPVTPTEPSDIGWLSLIADLPAWVTTTGMPWVSANEVSSAVACE